MTCNTHLNIENLVRSVVVLGVCLPVTLAATGTLNSIGSAVKEGIASKATAAEVKELQANLKLPCIKYLLSDSDSKLERTAKNEIDDVLGGEVDYSLTCEWVGV